RLQRATDAEFARARRDGRRDSPDAYAADALLAMLATNTHPPAPTADDPTVVPVKAEVLVLVDAISLQRGYARGGERCEIVGVGPVSVEWVRELLPEAIVHALVHDGVDITTYASATRSIRKAVRLAVNARDGCCVVPGCATTRRVQRDHRQEFANGGPGSTDNLNLLCPFHHNQKTRNGARLERHGDQWHWYPPNTTEPWTSPVGPGLTLWDTS
ncbi:MAG TPA: HNH endonuclease signature motif containing protein, partial [Acidimicrobiales bacterium]